MKTAPKTSETVSAAPKAEGQARVLPARPKGKGPKVTTVKEAIRATPGVSDERVIALQNYVETLERGVEKVKEAMTDLEKRVEKKWKDWYNFQVELIYQRAFEQLGGEGQLYLSEHGANKRLFNPDLTFKAPALPDRSSEYPEEPTEEKMRAVANGNFAPQVNTSEPVEVQQTPAPTVEDGIRRVKLITGEALEEVEDTEGLVLTS